MDEQQPDNLNPDAEQSQQETPKNKKDLFITIAIVSVVVIGGAVAGYLFIYSSSKIETSTPVVIDENDIEQNVIWSFQRAFDNAVAEKNPNNCDRINIEETINDVELTQEQLRNNCKTYYSIEIRDVDYCQTLSDKLTVSESGAYSLKDVCLNSLASILNKPELCELMPIIANEDRGAIYLKSCLTLVEQDNSIDTDNDGVVDTVEEALGTDPNNPDTDGDGFSDGEEISNGFNPLGEGILEE